MLRYSVEKTGKAFIIVLEGRLNIDSIPVLETAWEEILLKSPASVAIDCASIAFIDSSSIGALVKFFKQAQGSGISLYFLDLSENISMLFETAGLDSYFKIASRSEFEKSLN